MKLRAVLATSRLFVLAATAAAVFLAAPAAAAAATITVTGTGDTVVVDGAVTLREAITSINNGSNVNADVVAVGVYGTSDTINFDIMGGCATVCTVTLLSSPLPTITKPVIINGYSQSGSSVNTLAVGDDAVLKIEIDGTSAGNLAGGLINIDAGSSTVKGLIINRAGAGNSAIRTSVAGSNFITGNFLGTDRTGTLDRGNNVHGVLVAGGNGNTIGGTAPADRNVISANKLDGIVLSDPSTNNTVQGNYVGTNASGTAALGNLQDGIELANSSSNLIGGTAAGAGNVISASGLRGIFITSSLANSNTVQGNLIGTDATGTIGLGNTLGGIGISNNASNNTIGGTTAGARNVISGNGGFGIEIHGFSGSGATGNVIQGNFIGTDASGAVALGNTGDGVDTILLANGNTIGGAPAGAGNVIAFNTGLGVGIGTGTGNAILGNSIFSNGGLGIDLGFDGVTANDHCDPDTGPNNLQNYPVITNVTSVAGTTVIDWTLDSTASTPFRIEYFSSPSCDPSGFGEGKTLIGTSSPLSTGPTCALSVITTISPLTLVPGSVVTMTATLLVPVSRPLGFATQASDTSEFSQCFTVPGATPTPTPTNTPSNTPAGVPTNTPTNTPSNTPVGVATNTPTSTPTATPTPTVTPVGGGFTPTPPAAIVPTLSPSMLGLLALALAGAALLLMRRS